MSDNVGRLMRIVSLLGMWAVVVHHCGCGSMLDRYAIPLLTYWAVPWFFMVSGFFFMASLEKRGLWAFLGNKVAGLCVPFLLWCLIGLGISLIGCGERETWTLSSVFGFTADGLPQFNGPCWYLRELMMLMIVAGLFSNVLGKSRLARDKSLMVVAGLSIVVWCGLKRIGVPVMFQRSALFFAIGIIVSRKPNVLIGGGGGKLCTIIVGILAVALRMIWFLRDEIGFGRLMNGVMDNICDMTTIVSIWLIVKTIGVKALSKWVDRLGSLPMFVYLCHMPILAAFVMPLARLAIKSGTPEWLVFVLLSLLYTPLVMIMGLCIKRLSPRLYRVLVGGRA